MEHSTPNTFADIFAGATQELDRVLTLRAAKTPGQVTIQGFEALSIGENTGLFFDEFFRSVDKRMASFNRSVHKVDVTPAERNITGKKLLFVKNSGVLMPTYQGFRPGMANMAGHVQAVIGGMYLISSLKTEAARLYHWLKEIAKNGRIGTDFKWTISDFEKAVTNARCYLENLPEQDRQVRHPLSQVYISFEEFFGVVTAFNSAVSNLGARDIEIITKELTAVYEMGSLIVMKIKQNDLQLSEDALLQVESVVNRFVDLTNLVGAMTVLLNELSQVLADQVQTLAKI